MQLIYPLQLTQNISIDQIIPHHLYIDCSSDSARIANCNGFNYTICRMMKAGPTVSIPFRRLGNTLTIDLTELASTNNSLLVP